MADPIARSVFTPMRDEMRHWTNNIDPAFMLWLRDERLYGCITDLRIGGADRSGRPARARCFVAVDRDGAPDALRQCAALLENGVPDGFIAADPSLPTGFKVSSDTLPMLLGSPDDPRWPEPERQQQLDAVKDAARWLLALPDRGRDATGSEQRLALGSPLLGPNTAELASEYSLIAGPGLEMGVVPRNPKDTEQPGRRTARLPTWMIAALAFLSVLLFLAVLTLAL